jgi:L-lactate dehydrogenase complex protein LldF
MRHWREREFAARLAPRAARWGLGLWAFVATRPALYRALAALAARTLGLLGARGRFRTLPLAHGWTQARDLPAPEGRSFMSLWRAQRR